MHALLFLLGIFLSYKVLKWAKLTHWKTEVRILWGGFLFGEGGGGMREPSEMLEIVYVDLNGSSADICKTLSNYTFKICRLAVCKLYLN